MNGPDFNRLVKGLEEMEEAILLSKGKDYTQGDADRLKNFKKLGAEIGSIIRNAIDNMPEHPSDQEKFLEKVGALTVWWVYFRKHIDALHSYVASGRVESEGLTGRINDVRNYAALGAGLMVDFGDMPLPEVKNG